MNRAPWIAVTKSLSQHVANRTAHFHRWRMSNMILSVKHQCLLLCTSLALLCGVSFTGRSQEMTPVRFPVSVEQYDERDSVRVLFANALYVAVGNDAYRKVECDQFEPCPGDARGFGLKLSSDGRYVFVSAGPDGLVRYDREMAQWKSIRPPGVPPYNPAIAIGPDGKLYAGYGQDRYSTAHTGLFVSTDDGESWTERDLWIDTVKIRASIREILVTPKGRLILLCQPDRTAFRAVYHVDSIGVLRIIEGTPSGGVCLLNETVCHVTQQSLELYRPTGQGYSVKTLRAPSGIEYRRVMTWPGNDTVVVIAVDGSRCMARFIVDTVLVGTLDLFVYLSDFSYRPNIFPSKTGNERSLVISAAGRNDRISMSTLRSAPISCSPERVRIRTIATCRQGWGIASIWGHGWYRFDTTATVSLDTLLSRQALDDLKGSIDYRSSDIFLVGTGWVVRVSASGYDTLYSSPPADRGRLIDADLHEGTNELLLATKDGITRRNLSTGIVDTLSLAGWPQQDSGQFRTYYRTAVMTLAGRTLAWAERPDRTKTIEGEGLYEYVAGAWKKIEGATFGVSTGYFGSVSSDSIIVLIASDTSPLSGTLTLATSILGATDTSAFVVDSGGTSWEGYATAVNGYMLLHVGRGRWHRVYPSGRHDEFTMREDVTLVWGLADRFVVSTEDRGVFLVAPVIPTTSTQDNTASRERCPEPRLYPNPVDRSLTLNMTIHACSDRPEVNLLDVLGRNTRVSVQPLDQAAKIVHIQVPSELGPGLYFVVINGDSCRHAVPTIVR